MQDARQSTLPGETSDFEYQPTETGNLQLEVFQYEAEDEGTANRVR
jgi:hypothetical protein